MQIWDKKNTFKKGGHLIRVFWFRTSWVFPSFLVWAVLSNLRWSSVYIITLFLSNLISLASTLSTQFKLCKYNLHSYALKLLKFFQNLWNFLGGWAFFTSFGKNWRAIFFTIIPTWRPPRNYKPLSFKHLTSPMSLKTPRTWLTTTNLLSNLHFWVPLTV